MSEIKLYKVQDNVTDQTLGYFDNKNSILIAIYKYLRKLHDASNIENKTWLDNSGKSKEFDISPIVINKNLLIDSDEVDIKCDIKITENEYENFMRVGPREIILKKLLDNDKI